MKFLTYFVLLFGFIYLNCSAPKLDDDFLKEEENSYFDNTIVQPGIDSTLNLKMDTLGYQIANIEKMVNNNKVSESDVAKKIDTLQKDLSEIKRNLSAPVIANKIETLDSTDLELSKKINNIEKKIKEISTKKNIPTPAAKIPSKNINTFDDFNSNYDYGIRLFNEKKYDEAIQIFQNLLGAKLRKPDLIDNIYYWLGECFFSKGKYETSIDNFSKSINIPNANKTDDCLMMIGAANEKLDKIEAAREAYQRLVDTQPKSRYIKKAKSKLKSLI
jgi:TolA-binding protein